MKAIQLAVIFYCASAGFVKSGQFAQDHKQADLAKAIAHLPWETDEVVVYDSPKADTKFILDAHYGRRDVVADRDIGYVSVHPAKRIFDKNGILLRGIGELEWHSKDRDGTDRWCNGAGNFENVTKSGFDYHLSLSWQIDGQSKSGLDYTFHCLWIKEQRFKKDGFIVTIKVLLKR